MVEDFDVSIIGTILISDLMATILSDLGSTYSYVSIKFSLGLDMACDMLDFPLYVSTPVGDSMLVTHVYHNCLVL